MSDRVGKRAKRDGESSVPGPNECQSGPYWAFEEKTPLVERCNNTADICLYKMTKPESSRSNAKSKYPTGRLLISFDEHELPYYYGRP